MTYVKIDQDILDSSVWPDRDRRSVWFTMLVMARPQLISEPQVALDIDTMKPTGWMVPPGRYGMVRAASDGIADRDKCSTDECLRQLRSLSQPDYQSRSPDFDGRRIARVSGGYIVLNYARYRDQEESSTERVRKWKNKKREEQGLPPLQPKKQATPATVPATPATVPATLATGSGTHVDVDVDVDGREVLVTTKAPPTPPPKARGGGRRVRAPRSTSNGNGVPPIPVTPGQSGSILAAIKADGIFGHPLDVRQALSAVGGLAAIRDCPPQRWGLLTRDFGSALDYARANPEQPKPKAVAAPAETPVPIEREGPTIRATREREEAWLAAHPGETLPADFHFPRRKRTS